MFITHVFREQCPAKGSHNITLIAPLADFTICIHAHIHPDPAITQLQVVKKFNKKVAGCAHKQLGMVNR